MKKMKELEERRKKSAKIREPKKSREKVSPCCICLLVATGTFHLDFMVPAGIKYSLTPVDFKSLKSQFCDFLGFIFVTILV